MKDEGGKRRSTMSTQIQPNVDSSLIPHPSSLVSPSSLTPPQWGMIAFLTSEVAVFGTLIAVYFHYLGMDQTGPTPAVLSLPLVICTTICLLSSSVTIHLAAKALRSDGQRKRDEGGGMKDETPHPSSLLPHPSAMLRVFRRWWSATIVLGIVFLAGTAYEWSNLIREYDLTISRNLFGTTYYTLVGLHALHVTVGVLIMLIVLGLTFKRPEVGRQRSEIRGQRSEIGGQVGSHTSDLRPLTLSERAGIELVSWYWHFVDGVWVVVFSVVYLVGR
jgi:cytochrome c oxidase subunit 3/cytochrome o ubiquinol oxidase subunit 3